MFCAQSGKKSAIDLLSTTNLINYFGKANDLDAVDITPILLEKGIVSSVHSLCGITLVCEVMVSDGCCWVRQ